MSCGFFWVITEWNQSGWLRGFSPAIAPSPRVERLRISTYLKGDTGRPLSQRCHRSQGPKYLLVGAMSCFHQFEKGGKGQVLQKKAISLAYRGDKRWWAPLLSIGRSNLGPCHGISSHTYRGLLLTTGVSGRAQRGIGVSTKNLVLNKDTRCP